MAPEAVIFCGIQASGKSTYYRARYFETHVRISLDLLRTRHRERTFLEACLATLQPFVVDNTNPTIEERRGYVEPARAAGYALTACLFDVAPREAIARNEGRTGRSRIPIPGILGTRKRLEPPRHEEGFDSIVIVRPDGKGGFAEEPLIRSDPRPTPAGPASS